MARQVRLKLKQLQDDIEHIRRELSLEWPFDYQDGASRVRRADELLHEAVGLGNRELHHLAARVFWEAVDAAYPGGFWESFDRLRQGDSRRIEDAVRFLLADPWFHRSGYIKADLLRFISRIDIPDRYHPRLRSVLLAAVDFRDRREFRSYCRLARAIDSPELRDALTDRLNSDVEGIRRRARWMLEVWARSQLARTTIGASDRREGGLLVGWAMASKQRNPGRRE